MRRYQWLVVLALFAMAGCSDSGTGPSDNRASILITGTLVDDMHNDMPVRFRLLFEAVHDLRASDDGSRQTFRTGPVDTHLTGRNPLMKSVLDALASEVMYVDFDRRGDDVVARGTLRAWIDMEHRYTISWFVRYQEPFSYGTAVTFADVVAGDGQASLDAAHGGERIQLMGREMSITIRGVRNLVNETSVE